jgi:hypothetical protein
MTPGISTLTADETRQIVAAHPEVETDEGKVLLVVAAKDNREAKVLGEFISASLTILRDRTMAADDLMELLLPRDRLRISKGMQAQIARNAEAKENLNVEFGLLSSSEVAALSGSDVKNRQAAASRWRTSKKIFGIPSGDAFQFLGFQFDETGRPRPIISRIIATLGSQLSGSELALWFTSHNGWLDDRRPVDLLISNPDLVERAAEALANELEK